MTPSFSIVVPSRNPDNLAACLSAVQRHEPELPRDRYIVVDDSDRQPSEIARLCEMIGWTWAQGRKPFVYARAANQGIAAALWRHDCAGVMLIGDDTILETPHGYSLLAETAAAHPEYGVIASTTNYAGNRAQFPQGKGLRDELRMVCYISVFISREAIEKAGLLDESLVGYGRDDDAHCREIRGAGFKIGIHDGCFVDHKTLPSTFRTRPDCGTLFAQNKRIYAAKYGAEK